MSYICWDRLGLLTSGPWVKCTHICLFESLLSVNGDITQRPFYSFCLHCMKWQREYWKVQEYSMQWWHEYAWMWYRRWYKMKVMMQSREMYGGRYTCVTVMSPSWFSLYGSYCPLALSVSHIHISVYCQLSGVTFLNHLGHPPHANWCD